MAESKISAFFYLCWILIIVLEHIFINTGKKGLLVQLAINKKNSMFLLQAQTHLKMSGNKLVINDVTKQAESARIGMTTTLRRQGGTCWQLVI
ncbi:MAG: hypothetical protein KAS17_08530 [Victivallaceae bacterium]|nr:hypothetical protein [Victivallaceae bacterium]